MISQSTGLPCASSMTDRTRPKSGCQEGRAHGPDPADSQRTHARQLQGRLLEMKFLPKEPPQSLKSPGNHATPARLPGEKQGGGQGSGSVTKKEFLQKIKKKRKNFSTQCGPHTRSSARARRAPPGEGRTEPSRRSQERAR